MDQDTVMVVDLATEDRWPVWAPKVHQEFGATSMMSLFIFSDERSYGALSLYVVRGRHFDVDVAVAQALAQLGMAIISRSVIGRAEGILMVRLNVTADEAFDYMRRVSSQTNRKLVIVASDIARTRELPTYT